MDRTAHRTAARRKVVVCALAALLLVNSTGCVATAALWSWANEPIYDPRDPYSPPRRSSERRAFAIAATPFTLAIDVAVTSTIVAAFDGELDLTGVRFDFDACPIAHLPPRRRPPAPDSRRDERRRERECRP
jgi:hypothetical protein